MKKKIIGISVAAFGVILSIGGAVALYTRAAEDTGFGISQGTYEGSDGAITYKVNGATSGTLNPSYLNSDGENGGTGLGGDYTQVYYEATLSAEFSNTLIPQNYVVGNLAVTIGNIPSDYFGKLSIWVDVDGYEADSIGAQYYGGIFMNYDYEITEGTQTMSLSHDIAVATSGVQKVRIFLKYELDEVSLLAKDEASLGYSLNISWGAPYSFDFANVVGTGTLWTVDEGYAMAPNINKPAAEGFEWVFNNLPGTFGEAKCLKGEDWSSGENYSLDAEKTYDVYWSGSAESAANFQEQA